MVPDAGQNRQFRPLTSHFFGLDDGQELANGPFEIVIDDHMVAHGPTYRLFLLGLSEAGCDLFFLIASIAQAALLLLTRGRHHENEHGVGEAILDLTGPVNFDFKNDNGIMRGFGERRAVVVAEKLGPLQKPASRDSCFKRRSVGEHIRVCPLPGPPLTRRPRS